MLKIIYLVGEVIYVMTTVRICGRWYLVALEEQLPGVFVSCFEEPLQGVVLFWVEIP